MSSDWQEHPSGRVFRTRRDRTGEILYQVDHNTAQWLSRSEFDSLTSGQDPRAVPRTPYTEQPGSRLGDFRLFPPDNHAQTPQGNAPDTVAGSTGPHYQPVPRNAGGQGAPGRHGSAQTTLTPLGQAIVKFNKGDYNGLLKFVLQNPKVVAQSEINSLLNEAAAAQRAGREDTAQTYVFYAVVLQRCLKYKSQEELESLFQRFASGGETAKDLISSVKKVHDAIRSKVSAPQPQSQDRVPQGMATAAPAPGRADHPRPRIIQESEQSRTVPRPIVDRVNSLPSQSQLRRTEIKDGRLVYVDDEGREVRPAGGRQELQRGRRDSESGPPTERLAKMKLDESRDTRSNMMSAQNKGKGSENASLRPDQAMDRRMGHPGGGNQQRRKYTIEGTDGDRESLDGTYIKRPNSNDFFRKGKVFSLLWHQSASSDKPKFELSKEISVARGPFQQEIHSSIRRMVVVKEGHGHCWCLMIYTYGEQGVLKGGLSNDDRKKHTVIYMTGERPLDLPDAHLLDKEFIAVDPASPDQRLHKMSRLDFRRVHTVEHNVKVKDIGRVARRSMPYLESYWQAVVNGR